MRRSERFSRPARLTVLAATAALALVALVRPVDAASGRLDLDIDPEEALVYLDGRYMGECDDYDGSPDYLYVEEGAHTIEFRDPEYQTLRILFEIRGGQALQFDNELRELDRGLPEVATIDLRPKRTSPPPPPPPPPPSPSPSAPIRPAPDAPKAEIAFVQMLVEPADAAVWIDGVFFGVASQYDGNPERAKLRPGSYTLELTRPGYRGFQTELVLRAEQERTVRATLEPGS